MYIKSIVPFCIALLSFSSASALCEVVDGADANVESCKTWDSFIKGNKDNVLLDFSYAGYMHGEVEAPDAYSLGYEVFNVVDFGAVANDNLSDRQAFIDAVAAAKKKKSGVVYFPEGDFILHDTTDNVDGRSSEIVVDMSNLIIKGAGRDKTTLLMMTPNLQKNKKKLYSSPVMISVGNDAKTSLLTEVTGDAAEGSFSVRVASTKRIKVGDWVCLYLKNNDPKLVAQELAPYKVLPKMTNLIKDGVTVTDYHQVVAVEGDEIKFKEPIMHGVESKWGWKIYKYPHNTDVGVEDLTLEGHCKENFKHHGSWEDDGAYKPIDFVRLTNSWMRRVTFRNVSEAMSVKNCANISVYDIDIVGRRGHSAIRSQGSSRVFMGKVVDNTDGRLHNGSGDIKNAGQFHGCGVSKPSMGAVLWGLEWGDDSCFESHATQPRATLIDNCKGGFMTGRAGGAVSQVPNHLANLVLWNLEATTPAGEDFAWWDHKGAYWKFLPPVIVGFHGEPSTFDQTQVRHTESIGDKVYPESLYEAQLEQRLGYVPAWLNNLK